MKKDLYIYGAGGLGKEVLSLIRSLDQWEVKGFFDDSDHISGILKGLPVTNGHRSIGQLDPGAEVVLAIGDPLVKQRIVTAIQRPVQFPVIIHPSAIIQDPTSVKLGPGTIVCAGVILTCDIAIENHVLLNLNTTIGHDSVVGSYSSAMPGVNIAGEVRIGEGVLLGSGCNVRNRVSIGDRARVGMGAVVLNDVEPGRTVVGVPAK